MKLIFKKININENNVFIYNIYLYRKKKSLKNKKEIKKK